MSSTPSQGEIRAWAQAEGLDCNAKGNLPKSVVDAFHAANTPDGERPDSDPPPETEGMSVLVTLPEAPEWEEQVAQTFADLLGTVFAAGRDAEKTAMLRALGVTT